MSSDRHFSPSSESARDLRLAAFWTAAALVSGAAVNWLAILWMAGRFSFE